MSSNDKHLPEDLHEIASRLSAARATPTGLELDELRRRIRARSLRSGRPPSQRGLLHRSRMRGVAFLLTLGLTLSSGVGVVLACESLGSGGGGSWSWPSPPPNASWCQYHGPWSYTDSWKTKHSTVTVLWVWNCKKLTVTIRCGVPFGFNWGGGPWYYADPTSYTATAPQLTSGLVVDADGTTLSFSNNGSTVRGTASNSPNFSATFNANGGSGSMASETANVPTALTSDGFTRSGYTFSGWNTAANGSGTAYANGGSYAFTANTTLYAQWKANPSFTVSFSANGGSGTMAAETKNVPTALTSDGFTRSGYTFSGWNTAANGSGTAYANGGSYAFTANTTLYAQWHR
ncbi:MAG TPA: InlB B-repeat-containing protein [Solirubrobacteraceae bacterium]|jgi:uncharacterized repeat protein (TIGR02543 family)